MNEETRSMKRLLSRGWMLAYVVPFALYFGSLLVVL
jgi:hypothetical protein